jgi:hypothetical protein
MTSTGISINKESWLLLREEPLYSPRFIDREGTDELALVVRVELLDFFIDQHPPLSFALNTWQSSQGTWVVLAKYRLPSPVGPPQAGVFYLNPWQVSDSEILRKILQRDTLPVIFLSEDCQEHYTVSIPHDPQLFTQWQLQLREIAQETQKVFLNDDTDVAFAAAIQEIEEGVS